MLEVRHPRHCCTQRNYVLQAEIMLTIIVQIVVSKKKVEGEKERYQNKIVNITSLLVLLG